jgi:hypothetical protein
MNRFGSFRVISLASITVSACPGFRQMQDSLSPFAQATHTASTADYGRLVTLPGTR